MLLGFSLVPWGTYWLLFKGLKRYLQTKQRRPHAETLGVLLSFWFYKSFTASGSLGSLFQ